MLKRMTMTIGPYYLPQLDTDHCSVSMERTISKFDGNPPVSVTLVRRRTSISQTRADV